MSSGKQIFVPPEEGGGCLHVKGKKSGEFCWSRVRRSVRKESDVELEVGAEAADPDVSIPSIKTDGETCSPGMNIGSGKEDSMKLGGMFMDPDIPITSIELDGDEFMGEEELEERLVELQNGKDDRFVIEEESSDVSKSKRQRQRLGWIPGQNEAG